MATQSNKFDPLQYGAKPVASFDPTQFGAKPIQQGPFKFDVGQLSSQERQVQTNQRVSRFNQETEQYKKEAGAGAFARNFLSGLPLIGAPIRQGLATGQQLATGSVTKSLVNTQMQAGQTKANLLKTIREKEAKGQDTRSLKIAYNNLVENTPDYDKEVDRIIPGSKQTYGQALGNVGEIALDMIGAGTFGKNAAGSETGKLLVTGNKSAAAARSLSSIGVKSTESPAVQAARAGLPSILPRGTAGLFTKEGASNVLRGGAFGYGSDITMGLQGRRGEDREGVNSFIPGLGTGLGFGIPLVIHGIQSAVNLTRNVKNEGLKRGIAESLYNRDKAVNDLEEKYTEISTGTQSGRRRFDKAQKASELKNLAGTEGRPPQRVLAESGVVPNIEGHRLATTEQADQLRESISPLAKINRKALQEVARGTGPIDLNDIEEQAIARVRTPRNIDAGTADGLESEIRDAFSGLRKQYGNSIDIVKLDDIKSARWGKVPFNTLRPLQKDANYAIAKTAQSIVQDTAKAAGNDAVAQLNREIGDRLDAASFLEGLNGRVVKGGQLKRYAYMAIGSTLGTTLPGKIVGALGGDMVAEILISNSVSNPVKSLVLQNIQQTNPQAYDDVVGWLSQQNLLQNTRLQLPAPDDSTSYINQGRPIRVLPSNRGNNVDYFQNNNDVVAQSARNTRTINSARPTANTVSSINNISDNLPQSKGFVNTIDRHIQEARGYSPDDIQAGGGLRTLIKGVKDDIVAGLSAEGFPDVAQKVQNADVSKIKSVDELSYVIKSLANDRTIDVSSFPAGFTAKMTPLRGLIYPSTKTAAAQELDSFVNKALLDGVIRFDDISEASNALVQYIRQNGIDSIPPIQVNAAGRIIDGVHRYDAFKQLGYKQIPTIIVR
jgi:hypothetical protein